MRESQFFSALQLVHPIVCDRYNLCEMVKANTLAKQKLGKLQQLQLPQLAVPVPVGYSLL